MVAPEAPVEVSGGEIPMSAGAASNLKRRSSILMYLRPAGLQWMSEHPQGGLPTACSSTGR